MSTQPMALFLADVIEADWNSKAHHEEAAAELRRLHAENALLHERHRFDNGVLKELLEALKLALSAHGVMLLSDPPQEAWKTYGVEQKARAAIAKAEGGQT